jgi:hypothetical protein
MYILTFDESIFASTGTSQNWPKNFALTDDEGDFNESIFASGDARVSRSGDNLP